LDILGNTDPAPDWSDLYKVHEILLDNVPNFYQRGWVTKNQISTFTASANRREVSGDLARQVRCTCAARIVAGQSIGARL
jgi:hypothetical protein